MSNNSFDIPDWMIKKWQEIADLLAELISIPAALIMKTENEFMEVFISSNSEKNPYKQGDKEHWYGLYCETVIKTQNELLIPNALKDKDWNKNPDIKLGMISYLGYAINFPDNQPFGTICVLDDKENSYSETTKKIILKFKDVIEQDLVLAQFFDLKTNELTSIIKEQQSQIISENKILKAAEQTLKKYKIAIDSSNVSIVITDINGNIEYANPFFTQLTGYTLDEYIGQDPKVLNSGFHTSEFYKQLWDTILSGKSWEGQFYNKKKNGEYYWEKAIISPISNENNEIINFVAIKTDVTETINAQTELLKAKERAEGSEEKYHLLSDLNHEGLAIHDMGVLLEANRAFFDIFGYSAKELTGKYAIDILFTEESIKILLPILKQPSTEPYVVEGIHKSGRHLWLELEARDFTFRGTPVRFVLFRDITEKKKQEDVIFESHKRFKRLTELTNEGILIHKNGIAIDVNPAFEKYMGTSRDKLIGKNFISFLDNKKSQDIIQTEMKKDYASPYEVEMRNEKGKMIILQITSNFLSKQENLRVALIREITEEKEEEKRIMNAIIEAEEKERSYFSKELHDGLGPVLSSLNMYFEWLSDTDEVKEKELILKNGMENINEAVNIVDEISNRLTPRTLNSFGINAAIETFIARLQIGDTLQFHFSSNLTERLTMHREAAIYRVITELINNSMKHASAKNITIDIRYKKTDNCLIILYLDDGVGFNFKNALKKNEGFGLVNIMERVKTYNGIIKFTTALTKGLKVEMNFYNAIQINED